jgi:hypothetical protein
MKRKDQEEFSSKLSYYGFIGILITLLILVITNR